MVKIRLARFGKKNDPFYRIVAIDSAKRREGSNLDVLGYWHPQSELLKVDKKSIKEWVSKGAQVTPAVTKLLS